MKEFSLAPSPSILQKKAPQDGFPPVCEQQDNSYAHLLSPINIATLERERRIPGISFPNLLLHLQPPEKVLQEQQRSSNWGRQGRCAIRLAYRSDGHEGMK